MRLFTYDQLNYYIFDPTGNITALVESKADISMQPKAAEIIMQRHPEVEQVGFVQYGDGDGADVILRMAGGEFCGNASISAAAWFMMKKMSFTEDAFPGNTENVRRDMIQVKSADACKNMLTETQKSGYTVRLDVSGTRTEVKLNRTGEKSFYARIKMPEALSVEETFIDFGAARVPVPVIKMKGISHILIQKSSPLFALKDDHSEAEDRIRLAGAGASCLGFMFLEDNEEKIRLTPLVFVPGSGTMFWENSCASGSAAAGMYFALKKNAPVDMILEEPGGSLRVVSRPGGPTYLFGGVSLRSAGNPGSDLMEGK